MGLFLRMGRQRTREMRSEKYVWGLTAMSQVLLEPFIFLVSLILMTTLQGMCGRLKNGPLRCPHLNPWNCEYGTLRGQRDLAGVI